MDPPRLQELSLMIGFGLVQTAHILGNAKTAAETFTGLAGGIAAFAAAWTYWSNSKRERAKWAVQLYDKFYESDRYKKMRDELDCAPDEDAVQEHVRLESAAFTDYLNFFELVTFLAETTQISKKDVLRLFQYYLHCLKRHRAVMNYLNDKDKGFEQLRGFLNKTEL